MRHSQDHYYLLEIQYLGFRYHGWQKQPGVKTVQLMLEKTVKYVLGDQKFKLLGAGRTDAMVSVRKTAVQLMLRENLEYPEKFLNELNRNLPADIRALSIVTLKEDFNIIQDVVQKEYHYLFTHNEKMHPFCAPFMAGFNTDLDIRTMMETAAIFEGTQNFQGLCEYDHTDKSFIRTIQKCELVENKEVYASFFPKKSYVLKVTGKGFLRYQVRYMMGALLSIGENKLTKVELAAALKDGANETIASKAPASGLTLANVVFDI